MQPRSPLQRAGRSPGAHRIVAAPGATWCSARLRVSAPAAAVWPAVTATWRGRSLGCGATEVPPPRLALLPCRSVGGCACRRPPRVLAQAMGMDGQPRGSQGSSGRSGAGGEGGGSVGQVQDAGDDLAASGGCCTSQVAASDSTSTSRGRPWRLGPRGQGALTQAERARLAMTRPAGCEPSVAVWLAHVSPTRGGEEPGAPSGRRLPPEGGLAWSSRSPPPRPRLLACGEPLAVRCARCQPRSPTRCSSPWTRQRPTQSCTGRAAATRSRWLSGSGTPGSRPACLTTAQPGHPDPHRPPIGSAVEVGGCGCFAAWSTRSAWSASSLARG
jgi:hypothetical protein